MFTSSHLKSLQALELAVRLGSFREAGSRLAITPAAVGQRVKTLEDYLGLELLVRGRGGVRAAPELEAALPHLRHAFAALDAASNELDLQRGHELHIACVSDFAELWLAPRFARFRAAHPNLRVCINGEGDAPIRIGRVDCEIGYGPIADGALTDLLFRDVVLPLTSPANGRRTAAVDSADRLEGFPLLHVDFYKEDPAGLGWAQWIAANAAKRSGPERGMRFRRIARAMDAVLADAGFALCGVALLSELLDSGKVVPLFPQAAPRISAHGFVARYRAPWNPGGHLARFRAWLAAESLVTARWLSTLAGDGGAGSTPQLHG